MLLHPEPGAVQPFCDGIIDCDGLFDGNDEGAWDTDGDDEEETDGKADGVEDGAVDGEEDGADDGAVDGGTDIEGPSLGDDDWDGEADGRISGTRVHCTFCDSCDSPTTGLHSDRICPHAFVHNSYTFFPADNSCSLQSSSVTSAHSNSFLAKE